MLPHSPEDTDDTAQFFYTLHGRTLPALNTSYLLPVDPDEVKRSDIHHRLVQFLFRGKNYVGPVREALQFGQQRRVLDLGTGSGAWAIDIADEFPRAEVLAVDLAPVQPRHVPPNCTFELCDLAQWPLPFPDAYFDFIHARSLNIGMQDYPRFLREVARLLRPGGLLLLIEPTLFPCPPPARNDFAPAPNPALMPNSSHIPHSSIAHTPTTPSSLRFSSSGSSSTSPSLLGPSSRPSHAQTASHSALSSSHSHPQAQPHPHPHPHPHPTSHSHSQTPTAPAGRPDNPPPTTSHTVTAPSPPQEMPGWAALWRTFRACLTAQRVDVHVPEKLAALLAGAGGAFENITVHDGTVPVGFWPTDPHLLSAGQLQWMDYELLLPALRPLFLHHGLAPTNVDRLIQDAQHDLYHPAYPPSTRIHVAYANKRYS